jgi:hypothetical protein
MKKNIDKKVNLKKKWDVIIASTLLFVLNLVFVIFVIFQFVYFFGGSENIVGDNAGFTYAEYARKGFWELLFVSIVAYFIILILNLKVKIKGIIAKMVFYGKYILLSLSVLIINYSSYSRLRLYEEVYGFTVLRVLVFMAIIGIALQYIFLVVSPLVKDSYKFISLTTSFLVFIYYVIVVVMPLDYVVANLNMKRYRESGEIDVGYLLQLSDEAIPVLVDLTDEVSPSIKYVLLDELEYRYSIKEVHRDKWMSYNIWQERNDMMLKETLDEDKNWDIEARNQVQNIVDEYSQYIEDERFAEAYDEFWIEDAEKTEFLEDIEKQELEVVEYSIGENVYISQYGLRHGLNLPIEAKLTYIQKDDYSKRTVVKCLSGNLRLKLTGDGWKIVYEEIMPFGYIAGYGNYDMYHFEENSLNNYYMYYENKHTSWCD